MIKNYNILNISHCSDPTVVVGDVVYELILHDYGLANDDSRITRIEYISVTKNNNGGYPSFTIPLHDLELISN